MAILLFKYFPVFALLFSVFPTLIKPRWYQSAPGYSPETKPYFKRAYWGSLIYMIIIWAPMILGIFLGNVPTMVHFFQRGSSNFYVNLYWIVLASLSVLTFIWIFFLNGGDFLIKYYFPLQSARRPGTMRSSMTINSIKFFSVLSLIGLIVLWFLIIPEDVEAINALLTGLP